MSRVVTLLGYGLIMVCALGFELAARRRERLPTFGEVLNVVLRRWPLRVLMQASWLWLGWHLFVRVDWQ